LKGTETSLKGKGGEKKKVREVPNFIGEVGRPNELGAGLKRGKRRLAEPAPPNISKNEKQPNKEHNEVTRDKGTGVLGRGDKNKEEKKRKRRNLEKGKLVYEKRKGRGGCY